MRFNASSLYEIEYTTIPPDLKERLIDFPVEYGKAMRVTMKAAMLTVHESTPAYPPERPGQTYIRTGTLGRSLGVAQGGGVSGKPEIYIRKRIGRGNYEGHGGTLLGYAEYVIGERQAWMHVGRWWTVVTWGNLAAVKVLKLYRQTMQQLADFIEGKSG